MLGAAMGAGAGTGAGAGAGGRGAAAGAGACAITAGGGAGVLPPGPPLCWAIRSPRGSGPAPRRLGAGHCGCRRWWRCRRHGGVVAGGITQALADQRFQRVHGLGRVQVEHQPVLVGRHRLQGEDLGLGGLLEIDHQAHHAGRVLAHADGCDVGVVGAHLGDQLAQRGIEVDAFDVHGQPRRLVHEELLGSQRPVGLDGHARVLWRRPDAHGHDGGAVRNVLAAQQQHDGARLQQVAARQAGRIGEGLGVAHALSASITARPTGVPAIRLTWRCVSSIASI